MPESTRNAPERPRYSLLHAMTAAWSAAMIRRHRRGITAPPAAPRKHTAAQAKALARRRAKNKVARRSRRINRVRAGR